MRWHVWATGNGLRTRRVLAAFTHWPWAKKHWLNPSMGVRPGRLHSYRLVAVRSRCHRGTSASWATERQPVEMAKHSSRGAWYRSTYRAPHRRLKF